MGRLVPASFLSLARSEPAAFSIHSNNPISLHGRSNPLSSHTPQLGQCRIHRGPPSPAFINVRPGIHSAHRPFAIALLQTQQNRSSQNLTFFLQFGHFGSAPRHARQITASITNVNTTATVGGNRIIPSAALTCSIPSPTTYPPTCTQNSGRFRLLNASAKVKSRNKEAGDISIATSLLQLSFTALPLVVRRFGSNEFATRCAHFRSPSILAL